MNLGPLSRALRTIVLLATLPPAATLAQSAKLAAASHSLSPSTPPQLIVIGFAGGFIRHDSTIHGEIALASRLREHYGSALHVEVFENHHGKAAHREILRLLHTCPANRPPPRIILYGHSWGASEAVEVARALQHDGIPVQLLVQVDGVSKRPHDDAIIPANVAQAINFYQTNGLLHGRPAIYAADPAATRILGNIRFSYKGDTVPTPGYPWLARTFTKPHIEIESDPRVWSRVEALIAANLAPASP